MEIHTAVLVKLFLFFVFRAFKNHCIAIVSVIQRTVYTTDRSGGCTGFLCDLQISFSFLKHFCYFKSL